MSKALRATTLLIAATLSFPCAADRNPRTGTYSRHPVAIWDHIAGSPKPMQITAPDGHTHLTAQYSEKNGDNNVTIAVRGRMGNRMLDLGPGVGSELTWRSDSLAFFVTTSDEGANGAYRLLVSESASNTVSIHDLTPLIEEKFGHPFRCGAPETPNVGGVAWTPSGNVLVAAEVIRHSNCDSFGTFVLYEVDPTTMQIVHTYNQLEAKRLFRPQLGQELIAARDECIRKPANCYISTNHPAK